MARSHAVCPLALTVMLAMGACSSGAQVTAPATSAATTTSTTIETTTTLSDPATVAPVPSAGCTGSTAIAAGEEKVSITSGGADRYYFRHVPPADDGTTPMPVVVDLHGYSEGAQVHVLMSALGPFGDEHGFVTVTPQGGGAVASWQASPTSPDVTFIRAMLDQVEHDLCVDTARVYATGLSNGAMMTSALACALADRFAAVAPVAGVADIDGCAPSRPVPVIAFHGTADPILAYDGGYGAGIANLPAPDGSGKTLGDLGVTAGSAGPSVPEVVAAWAARNSCATDPSTTTVAADVALIAFACPPGDDVELYRVEGGGHAWPGSTLSQQVESIVGHTTFSISADELMWAFFQAHPLRPS